MRIVRKELKRGIVVVQADDLDDMWYLSQIVEGNDTVTGRTVRKIKLQGKDEQSTKIFKKSLTLSVKVEKIEFHEYSDTLRILGVVVVGEEDIPAGSYHTLSVEPGSIITIEKRLWLKYQLDRLSEAASARHSDILICVLDREDVCFAILKRQGYTVLSEFAGDVAKKADETLREGDFYEQVMKLLDEYVTRYKITSIILASPSFWKEDLLKRITNHELRRMITLATCNATGRAAIPEILKRPEIKSALAQQRVSEELRLCEELLSEIAKNGRATYGITHTAEAAQAGAIATLLVSTQLVRERQLGGGEGFSEIHEIMRLAESSGGSVHILNSEHDGGKKLDGLGGIAALLRYRLA